jgi:hypothetical protein
MPWASRMIKKILGNSSGHNLNSAKFPKSSNFMCTTCATGKLVLRPSPLKIKVEPLKFLERIQGDICGPIKPLSGSFKYFMILIHPRDSHMYVFCQYETMHLLSL